MLFMVSKFKNLIDSDYDQNQNLRQINEGVNELWPDKQIDKQSRDYNFI